MTLKQILSDNAFTRRQAAKARARREAELTAMFQVEERNGALWLCCGSVAYRRIPDLFTSEEVTQLLAEARQAAIEFDK